MAANKLIFKDAEKARDAILDSQKKEIAILKQQLADTDYKAIKYAEGMITAEDYAETKAQQQAWREQINVLALTLAGIRGATVQDV